MATYKSAYSGPQIDEAIGKALSIGVELLKSGSLNGTSSSETYSTNGHRLIILELYGNQSNTLWWAIPTARFGATYGTTVGLPFDITASSAIYVRGNISIGATSISVSNFASGIWSSVAYRIWGVL